MITNRSLVQDDKHTSYAKKAATGMGWNMLGAGVTKISSLASQFFLGWLLSREDFGVYAIAIAFSSLVLMAKNGGTGQVLIRRGAEFERLAPTVLRLAFVFNIAAAAGIVFLAIPLSELYQEPKISYLCWLIAISLPLATPTVIYRSRLSIDLKFSVLAKIGATSSVLRHSSMIVFALLGFGIYSFVLPLILVGIFEWYAYRRYTGPLLTFFSKDSCSCWIEVFRDSKWVLLGACAIALAQQGDYLIIGLMESKDTLGSYFFGYQLLASVSSLFVRGIEAVMLPLLIRFLDDMDRMRLGYLKVLRILAFLLMPIGISVALMADPVLRFFWGDKWESTIIVIQILSLCLPSWAFSSLSLSLLEANARWKLRTAILYIDAAGVLIAALIGAVLGGLASIALSMMIYKTIFSIFSLFVAASVMQLQFKYVINAVFWPILLAFSCGASVYIVGYFMTETALFQSSMFNTLMFVVMFFISSAVLQRDRLKDIFSILGTVIR